mmetsp:Transcript_22409/g.40428  ORF Transcript_22409/g.40428 Transcript_22409/m.40428 type:complete len:89 (-) Transcript_22409:364-630(-)
MIGGMLSSPPASGSHRTIIVVGMMGGVIVVGSVGGYATNGGGSVENVVKGDRLGFVKVKSLGDAFVIGVDNVSGIDGNGHAHEGRLPR